MQSLQKFGRNLLSNFKGDSSTRYVRFLSDTFPEYTQNQEPIVPYTTLSPKEHSEDHIGMWQTFQPDMLKRLFSYSGITYKFKDVADVIGETSFMIRKPYLAMVDLIKKSDLKKSPNKFLFYGKDHTGKTVSLSQVLYYLALEEFMLVHIAVPAKWLTSYKEVVPSTFKSGCHDHTVDASLWLKHFRQQNEILLQNPDFVTTEDYHWTQRDTTPKGSPLLVIVDFGISRARYASQVVFHLINELKLLANNERLKLAFVVDGMNSLFTKKPVFKLEDQTPVYTKDLTLIQAFLQLFERDWRGGIIVGSVDKIMSPLDRRVSHLPRYLLGRKGWAALDPFVPIPTSEYSVSELENVIDYYVAKKWLQHPAGATLPGKQELAFVSGRNPGELLKLINAH